MTAVPAAVVAANEPRVRALLFRCVGELGYGVEAVGDGRALLDRCRKDCPALVVADTSLPILTGLGAAILLRETHPVPIVLLSGRWLEPVVALLGCKSIVPLHKPFRPTELQAAFAAATSVLRRPDGVPGECVIRTLA